MATITSAGSGNWSVGGTWVGGVTPADDDAVVIAATHSVLMDADLSGYTGLRSVTINSAASGNPGMLYWKDGTSGYLKIRTGYTLVGTSGAVLGRVLANSDGVWGNTGSLAFEYKAVILLEVTAYINARYLSIALYCAQPTNLYVETYKSVYTCTTQSTDVNPTTNVITFTSAPPAAGTVVIVRSSESLPGGLSTDNLYYVRTVSGNTCKLALQNSDSTIVDITSTGSGMLKMYDGHTDTGTATINVIQDVTGDAPWVTTDGHDRVVMGNLGSSDRQIFTLVTINSGSLVLSDNVDSTQAPGSRIYLAARNVSIRSTTTYTTTYIITFASASTRSGVFQCEITSVAGTYGVGIYQGTGHVVSGIIHRCSTGLSSVFDSTVSGTIISCTTGALYCRGNTFSGTVCCTTGFQESYYNVMSGLIFGSGYGMRYAFGMYISGTIVGSSSAALSVCGGLVVSGKIYNSATGIGNCAKMNLIGTSISGCTTGITCSDFTAYNIIFTGNTTDVTCSGSMSGPFLNGISFSHAGVANDTRAYSAGGAMTSDISVYPSGKTYSYKFTCVDGSYWTKMECEIDQTEPLSLAFTVYAKHDATSLTADQRIHWQIVDPSGDPSLGGTVVAEWIAVDSTDWQSNAVSYVRTDYRRLLLRVSCKRSSGNAYFYLEPLSTGSKANAPAGLSYMG